jgi:predicted RNA-binding Zn-ribbon protein involved in translation (DUF1610 family)
MDLAAELQQIYDSEINVEIGWLWDGGIDVRLGDRMNGFQAETNVKSAADILPWLQEAIAHFYPESDYAKSLGEKVRKRASERVFVPEIRSSATCPHCGTTYFSPLEEVFAFVCRNCGNSVELPPVKLQ